MSQSKQHETILFDNGSFRVVANTLRQVYEVYNLTTGILEDTGSSHVRALNYALAHTNGLNEILAASTASAAWPSIPPETKKH